MIQISIFLSLYDYYDYLTIIWVMVWVCGNVCKRLPQFWSKRREMHKKGRENPEEGSYLKIVKIRTGCVKKCKKPIFLALFAVNERLTHAYRVAKINNSCVIKEVTRCTAPKFKEVDQPRESNAYNAWTNKLCVLDASYRKNCYACKNTLIVSCIWDLNQVSLIKLSALTQVMY